MWPTLATHRLQEACQVLGGKEDKFITTPAKAIDDKKHAAAPS
ncbi:hypothetical protein ACQXY3_00115 [Corynebacterium diphtheriae]